MDCPGSRASRRQLVLGLSGLVLWQLAGGSSPGNRAQGSPLAGDDVDVGTVTVHVEYVVSGGARPRPDPASGRPPPPPEPTRYPAVGVVVQAVPAGDGTAAPAATAVTDPAGIAALVLPAGSYWLIVPRPPAGSAGPGAAAIVRELPDGTSVSSWASVDLDPGATPEVTLSLVQLRP